VPNFLRLLCLFAAILPCVVLAADAPGPDAPIPAAEAPRHMTVPEGFEVTLFAGEPDVVQPIAFTFDDRGRLWVVECLSYPDLKADGPPQDRVTIFEDRDGDGRFDERKVFWDQGVNLTGIELGFGGVWLCSAPNLIFVPDRDADDRPDGPPEVVLDGWDVTAKHNLFNGLAWGPDGWLYGCNGILSISRVGPPGTPDEQRVPLDCGVWRVHPTRRTFEAVAHGTTNPWGVDWNDHGAMFITNCVIKHAFHIVPGGHYERMFGQDIMPHSFGLIPSCADHIHWAGGYWDTEGVDKPENDSAGGGHAHCGTMIYLGDNWPAEYRDTLFTINIHGHRVNNDRLERHGSGYVARHAPDVLKANDTWFRGVAIHHGPDGGVYISDWTDTGECHDFEEIQRTNGRIHKMTYGRPKHSTIDLAKASDAELVALQGHNNDWYVRHARRLLQERAAAGKLSPDVRSKLLTLLADANTPTTVRLRALWALHVIGGLDEGELLNLLADRDESLRGWTVRLLTERGEVAPAVRNRLAAIAANERSPLVRLELAAALQRLPIAERVDIALGLLGSKEDATDDNLPLLIWYGIEPIVGGVTSDGDGAVALRLLAQSRIPLLRNYIARRLALGGNLNVVTTGLNAAKGTPRQRDILQGLAEGIQGRRSVPMPAGWKEIATRLAASDDADVRQSALALSVVFGDVAAADTLRKQAADAKLDAAARTAALQVLVQHKLADLPSLLFDLLTDQRLRGPALRGLAAYGDPATPGRILEHYSGFSDEEKADAVSTLASRPAYAKALLAAIEQGAIDRNDLSPFTARQLAGLNDAELTEQLSRVWGTIRPAAEGKAELTAKYKGLLTREALAAADTGRGRQLFAKNCAACHRMFGEGGRIGPELTGAQRGNIDYVLENLLDPSAVVPRDYKVTLIETTDGRVITGIVRQENDDAVTLQTANDIVIVPKAEIDAREQSPLSMMPEGVLGKLTDDEVRDLVSYLASPTQVALPQ
jgi:putative membrane-bound dehydrogenase-like protein